MAARIVHEVKPEHNGPLSSRPTFIFFGIYNGQMVRFKWTIDFTEKTSNKLEWVSGNIPGLLEDLGIIDHIGYFGFREWPVQEVLIRYKESKGYYADEPDEDLNDYADQWD